MPKRLPPSEEIEGSEREELTAWFRGELDKINRDAEARVELFRTVAQHPSPIVSPFVKGFAALGVPKKQIAKLCRISVPMLNEHYADELELGPAELHVKIASNVARMAMSESDPSNAKMAQYWLDRRGGEEFKPPAQKIITSEEKKPPVIDSTKLSYEERQQLRAMIERRLAGGEGDPLGPDEIIGESDGIEEEAK
jgi:hypothetical protein